MSNQMEAQTAEDKFFGVKTTFDKKAKKAEEQSDIDLEIIDDRPEQDQRPQKAKDSGDDDISDDELGQYSEKVQKRLNKLKYDYHEERRQREAAERMREEAVRVAQQVTGKNQEYEAIISRGEAALVGQIQERAKLALEQARNSYRNAYEEGDTDKIIETQERLNKAQAEFQEAERYRNNLEQKFKAQSQPQYSQQAAQQAAYQAAQQAARQQQVPRPDPAAEEWAKGNEWFMKPGHEEMTALAYGSHTAAINNGIKVNSPEYFEYIDNRVRSAFPEYEWQDKRVDSRTASATANSRTSSVVAPSSRSNGAKPRKVQLSATQVSLAKRLGLTPEQYAKQLLKENM
jgi:hypothetical protein